ncbi:MAG TPA: response regulator [Devosia sp.]
MLGQALFKAPPGLPGVQDTPIMTDNLAVLVVEDEVLILLDVVWQLEAEGIKVYQASNADAASELLSKHSDIGLIFTDIDMPGSMDGLKLAAAVRHRWPPVKIIATSGYHHIDVADLPQGSAFFRKPYLHQAILKALQGMLSEGTIPQRP